MRFLVNHIEEQKETKHQNANLLTKTDTRLRNFGNPTSLGGAEFFGLGGLLFVGGQLFVFGLGSGCHDEFVAEVVKL
ncbi:MAG: hypothetical protein ACTSUQ_02465, partial [Candidatus Freyarchaeota archaeon]